MSRIRMIKPAFFKHADLFDAEASSGLPLRVAFAGLWTVADRRGVFPWSRNIKPDVLPYDACDMLAVLEALEAGGFVQKYEVDGKPYGIIPTLCEHQHFHRDEKANTLPAPGEHHASTVLEPDEQDGSTTTARRHTTYDIRHTASQENSPPPARAISTAEAELATQCAAHYPAIEKFLGERPSGKRAEWAADLLALIGPATGNLPEDLARACTDGHLAEPPVTNARTLRIFTRTCRSERQRAGDPTATSPPCGARPTKQEVGRANLAAAIERRATEGAHNGN